VAQVSFEHSTQTHRYHKAICQTKDLIKLFQVRGVFHTF